MRSIREPQCYSNSSESPYSVKLGLQDVIGLGSHVRFPLVMKHIDKKLAEKTHGRMRTHKQGQHGMPVEVRGGFTSRLLGG